MSTQIRTQHECAEELQIQLHLLRKAAHEFDVGDLHEFRNIARALRVIFAEDDHKNDALIKLAGSASVPILDTRMLPHPRSISPYFALAAIVLGPQTVGCRALLDDGPNRVPTDLTVWLEQTVVDDKEGGIFNRLRLIKAVANLGGGTHFSPDIRAYFAKLQDMGVTASRNGTTVRQTFVDVEKHSLRQIAHEVLASFDDRYRRLGQFEPGTLMIGPPSTVLYPGRKMQLAPIVKLKAGPAVMLKLPPHGFTDLRTSAVKLPYEETSAKSPCPCGSGLRFKACCSEARDFPPSFIEKFERQYSLGEFDVKTLS